jgi:hypothetical protein
MPTTVTVTKTVAASVPTMDVSATAAAPTIGSSSAAPTTTEVVSAPIPGNGTFRVGTEIAPGTYRSDGPETPQDTCSWSTHSSLGVGSSDIVDGNASTGGQIYAQIPGTVASFETHGCQT